MAEISAAVARLMLNFHETLEDDVNLDPVFLHLYGKNIIRKEECFDHINEERQKRRKQAVFLVQQIPCRGDEALPELLEFLKRDYRFLVGEMLTFLGGIHKEYAGYLRQSK